MKKILLASVALSALAIPVTAGPILDEMLGDHFTWTTDEAAVTGGVEVYSGLTVKGYGDTVAFEGLKLQKKDGQVLVQFEGMDLFPGTGDATRVGSGSFAGVDRIFDLSPAQYEALITDSLLSEVSSDQSCKDLNLPFKLSVKDIVLTGDPSADMTIDELGFAYEIDDPAGDCLVDVDFDIQGIKASDDGVVFALKDMAFDIYWSMLNGRVPANMDTTYTASFAMNDMSIAMGGAEQAVIDRISSQSSMDPASLKALIESGYFAAYQDMVLSEMTGAPLDMSKISIPAIWNAMGEITSQGGLEISGAEIKGDMAQAMTGMKLLARGRTLDIGMDYTQDKSDIDMSIALESDGLVDAGLSFSLVMDDMDPGLAEMGPSALMMSAPLSIASVSANLDDEALGALIAEEIGFNPYAMVMPALMDVIGPNKAEAVYNWLQNAQNGGATFTAAPDAPMPVLQTFAGFMGDWASFGDMINAEAN